MTGLTTVLLIGPPAAGKMTVGHEVCAITGWRLFHNHQTIEPLTPTFPYGTRAHRRLADEIRRLVLVEAIDDPQVSGLVQTFVWGLDLDDDLRFVQGLVDAVEGAGGALGFAELAAPLETRLARNHGEDRVAAKPSKADLDWSDANVLELDVHVMNTAPDRTVLPGTAPGVAELLAAHPHVRIDNTGLTAAEAAEAVVEGLGLPRAAG